MKYIILLLSATLIFGCDLIDLETQNPENNPNLENNPNPENDPSIICDIPIPYPDSLFWCLTPDPEICKTQPENPLLKLDSSIYGTWQLSIKPTDEGGSVPLFSTSNLIESDAEITVQFDRDRHFFSSNTILCQDYKGGFQLSQESNTNIVKIFFACPYGNVKGMEEKFAYSYSQGILELQHLGDQCQNNDCPVYFFKKVD